MQKLIMTFFLFYATLMVNAQTFKHTPFALKSGEVTSVFPIVSSTTRPKVAAVMNKTMQMMCFEQIPTVKKPTNFVTPSDEEYLSWSYTVDDSNNRLLRVTAKKWTPPGGMHTPDYYTTYDFLFDKETGDWGETTPDRDKMYHLWSGTIGEKIPVTLLIFRDADDGVMRGREIYDNFGIIIYLTFEKTGSSYRISELGDENQTFGYFEVTLTADGQMTGVWKNGDGSKTMSFNATTGVK